MDSSSLQAFTAPVPLVGDNVKVNKSCLECRRRKISCNGSQPCDKCVYYQVQDCQYSFRKHRQSSTRKSARCTNVETSSVTSANIVVNKLFPSQSPLSLAQLSREELLHLANRGSLPTWSTSVSEPLSLDIEADDERKWNEPQEMQDTERGMCDDVNGLSLRLQHRSYMGLSSTHAILRTMIRLRPSIQTDLKHETTRNWDLVNQGPIQVQTGYETLPSPHIQNFIPQNDESTCIMEYFARFHEVCPVLDEADFLSQWKRGDRSDRAWLALLNMVLVMGSLAASTADDHSYEIYYARAKSYLDFELLGDGCVESLQALCLLGGYYLHYKNAPNMGYAIMGAAFRMAIALGLHREPININARTGLNWKPTIRRNIWWCLFCTDTYNSMTLGRTTLGRWDPGTMNVRSPSDVEKKDSAVLSIDCSRGFCMIATRIQHRFAQFHPITVSDVNLYDAEVREWFQNLPSEWRTLDLGCSTSETAKCALHNRYHLFRLLLFRPFLLSYANRRVPFSLLRKDEQIAILKCQDIACEAIDHMVSTTHTLDRLRVWSAAWVLYQFTLVILLCIIIDPNHLESGRWCASIEKALVLFKGMAPWSASAARSRQFIARIYHTCGVPSDALYNMTDDEFDRTVYELGLNMYSEGWQWDATNWSDILFQYPEWTGE
ncbi:fungal-specific transcription factor domain-containing protein [Talaromyces proteolyticus]|uniref:Fungal-specific transcription factor domain-containing protein n=1 Tax=Talaromyces proteolyticus TaxID=1131652 RepID=A0AAD4PY86_9EURO|nr:fungal-specific transcription factor domain-containing protein [Talaromyces proteolyticus]KAH8697484.1 fungal-specific transcription factor domain-containing protein [Talaromyces proteolyticus]